METSVKKEEMVDKQLAFVASTEADESTPNSEVDLESIGPSISEPLYEQDSVLLKNILPEEIWRVILDKVKDRPEDAEACANATPYFRELLRKQRKEFLFSKVIEILAVRNEEREDYRNYNQDEQEMTKDYKVWRETLMSCREVCHAWNKGVEKCYQKREMSGIPEFVTDPDPRTRLKTQATNLSDHWTNRKYTIQNFRDAQKFLDRFQSTHFSTVDGRAPKNPFFGRFISIDVNCLIPIRKILDAYMATITTILEMWGGEIWYCCLEMDAKYEKAALFYRQLAHWLTLMPNLKYLELNGLDCSDEMTEEFFALNPLPTLDKLEALDLALGTPIINQLLSKNSHISILKTSGILEIDEDVIRSLTNLKGLSFIESELGNQIVEKYGAGWNLNRLTFEPSDVSMTGAYLFQCLQTKWASTLTELELRNPFVEEVGARLEHSRSLRLDHPFLRSLSLEVGGSFFLDFLLPSKNSLEHLTINQRQVVEDVPAELSESDQLIEYVGFEDKIPESNIWELFPKLKTLLQNGVLYERNCISKVPN